MPISVIYHHDERTRAEAFCSPLEREGYQFVYAPIGLEVGSQAWKNAVANDLKAADAYLLLLTNKAVHDPMVAWRVKVALPTKKLFVPLRLDRDLPDGQWDLPRKLIHYQQALADDAESVQFWQNRLKEELPKPTQRLICFLSYAREDSERANRVKADLCAHGIAVWRDVDDIPAGAPWDDSIAAAITDCTHFLLLVTPSALTSSNVSDEIGFARENKKRIIPLIIEKARLPFRIHRAQAVDFTDDYKSGIRSLIQQLLPSIE
jgi:hypothetical protein